MLAFNLQLPIVWAFLGLLAVVVHAAPHVTRDVPYWRAKEPFYMGEFTDSEKEVFNTDLEKEGLSIGVRLPLKGKQNDGCFSIASEFKVTNPKTSKSQTFSADKLFLKVLKPNGVEERKLKPAWAEVKALQDAVPDMFVASGKHKFFGEAPLIIMIKKEGDPVFKTKEYKDADAKDARGLEKQAKEMMCEEVAEIAFTKRLYHGDNHLGNYLVEFKDGKMSGSLVDWTLTYAVSKSSNVKKEDIKAYCLQENKSSSEGR